MKTSYATDLDKRSDAALVTTAKRGDAQALEELLSRYRQRVLALAFRITKNREDAEDIAQESFCKAYLHLNRFEERAQFSSWLTRIAMNEAFMFLRRRRGALETLPDSSDDNGNSVPEVFVDHGPSPEESCWRRQRTELLTEAINRLSPKVRTTIQLTNIEGRSVQETAKILGTSVEAVKARVFQARRKLRRIVNPSLLRGVYAAPHAGVQRY
jgi:RNA polymerase sigma-70 factor (ECF subfamily)